MTFAHQIDAGAASADVHIGSTAFLGIEISSAAAVPGGQASTGAQVAGLTQGSPLAATGLTAGDTITSLAGHTITSPTQIRSILNQYHPGDKVSVSWTDQSGSSQTASITLASGPAQ